MTGRFGAIVSTFDTATVRCAARKMTIWLPVVGAHAMKHRYDIDGLRAVAVVPIVLFHAGASVLAGGFVGVDVFFVISGYLITAIIRREIDEGQFSIAVFYRRRVTRIFPALFAMLAVVLAYGCATMLPVEIGDLGRSALAATAFVSNVFFWQNVDYFAGAAEAKPLLHTWSLAVEEQFYIFYPLLLIALHRWAPRRLRAALIVLSVGSFACGALSVRTWPAATFYLLPSRAWELALGGLVATGAFPKVERPAVADVLAVAGLGLIVAALFLVRESMPFPVPWALLPCVGAALLIAYGERTLVGQLLSLAPVRAIGLVSYSLYLWHWPIITFYRLDAGFSLGIPETLSLFAVSLVAATLSYFLVEQPVLRRFRVGATRPILVAGAAGLATMAAACVLVFARADLWRPLSPEARRIASYADYRARPDYAFQFRRGGCFPAEGERFDTRTCLALRDDRPNVVVLGDSHAAQYWRAIALRMPGANVMQATASGCRPTLRGKGAPRCRAVVERVLGPLLATGRVTAVVLAGRWQGSDIPYLAATIAGIRAAHARAIVIGPTVEYDGEFPSLYVRAAMHGDPDRLDRLRLDKSGLDRAVRERTSMAGGRYISALDIECPAGRCRLLAPDGGPMQFDYGHLTLSASRWVVGRMQF